MNARTAVLNLSENSANDRVCLKVVGPGFVIGMTIDVEPGHPLDTVGDLLRSLRYQQEEVAAVCRQFQCNVGHGDLYYRNRRLEQVNARLVQDVGINLVMLARGGAGHTLEYRIYRVSDESITPVQIPNHQTMESIMLEPEMQAALKNVLKLEDPLPLLHGLRKVLDNIDKNPQNERYRKIKQGNAKFQQLVGQYPGGIPFLLACGFRSNVMLDGVPHLQFPASPEHFARLKEATKIPRLLQEQLLRAKSLLGCTEDDQQEDSVLVVVPVEAANESLQIYRSILGPRHVLVAKGMNLVATVLYAQGHDDDAAVLCQEAKDIVEEIGGPNHPALAPILGNMAYMMKNNQERWTEMEALMARALVLQQPPSLNLLNLSAGVQMALGHYDNAIGQWEQVFEKLAETDRGYFVILGNIARARTEKGNDDEAAERDYLAAVRVCEQNEGPHHLQVAGILANLATVQDRLGRIEEAENNLKRALTIRRDALGFGNHLTQQVFRSLCQHLEHHKKYAALSDEMRRCCEFTEQALGPRHLDTAKALTNAGLVMHRFQNDARDAIPLLRKALEIYQACLGIENPDAVFSSILLGCALTKENLVEAETVLQNALNTAELQNNQKCLGPALSAMGAVDIEKDDFDMATYRLERGLDICIQAHGNDVFYTETCRRNLGKCYQRKMRFQKAREMYRSCRPYFERTFVSSDERLVDLFRDIAALDSASE